MDLRSEKRALKSGPTASRKSVVQWRPDGGRIATRLGADGDAKFSWCVVAVAEFGRPVTRGLGQMARWAFSSNLLEAKQAKHHKMSMKVEMM